MTSTDLPHVVPLVRSNIQVRYVCVLVPPHNESQACEPQQLLGIHRPLQANELTAVTAAPLAWGESVAALHPPFDVVLASDVLYQAEALPLFVQSLRELSSPSTLTLLCNEHRPALPFPWQLFWDAGFVVHQVPTSEQHPDWSSDDILLFHIRVASA